MTTIQQPASDWKICTPHAIMAPRGNLSMTAELSLVHLKNCLANLPPSLVTPLSNFNTAAQNVIVEVSPARGAPGTPSSSSLSGQFQRPIFLGWTGLPSRRKASSLAAAGRDAGFSRGGYGAQALDVPLIEMDVTLGRALGLVDGQRVSVSVHAEPPLVHTINIEPLTPDDWEMVELHAQFLELNLMAQVRAVPNPRYAPFGTAIPPYPLVLHLTPTSSAMVKVTGVQPSLDVSTPFAKISPDAEVIVAPKTRTRSARVGDGDGHSVASTRRSGRTGGGAAKRKVIDRPPVFLRGLDYAVCREWFDEGEAAEGYSVWVEADSPAGRDLDGVKYVYVHVMKPVGLQLS